MRATTLPPESARAGMAGAISRRRISLGLSIEDTAYLAGVHPDEVERVERGDWPADVVDTWARLLDALDIRPQLVGRQLVAHPHLLDAVQRRRLPRLRGRYLPPTPRFVDRGIVAPTTIARARGALPPAPERATSSACPCACTDNFGMRHGVSDLIPRRQ